MKEISAFVLGKSWLGTGGDRLGNAIVLERRNCAPDDRFRPDSELPFQRSAPIPRRCVNVVSRDGRRLGACAGCGSRAKGLSRKTWSRSDAQSSGARGSRASRKEHDDVVNGGDL
uniref:Uncharacterized protein n=1 Tax=Steinernema glaseri TaxID=37863 RepID=A0A1I7Y7P2_9BILA